MIRLRRGVQSFGLLAILLGLWGCGSQQSVPPPEPQQAAAAPVAPPPPPVEPPPAEPEPAAVPLAPAPPEKPSRPEDVSQWQADDFRAARREADPRLPEAIKSLGQRSSKDASVVPLLVELLEVEKPKENAGGGTETAPNLALRPGGQVAAFASAEVIAAAIAALGNNGTPEADQVLERLLAGQLDTGAQLGTVTSHVLDALVAHPSPEHNELMLTVAFTPEKFLAAAPAAGQAVGGGGRDGMQLRRDVLERLRAGTSPELRTRLAERLPAEPLSAQEQQPFVDLLLEPLAENVRAQLILIRQPNLEPATRLKLQGLFSQLVAASLNRLLGIPEGVRIQAPAGYNSGPSRGGAVGHSAPGMQLGDPVLPAGFSFQKTPEPPADAPGPPHSPPRPARGAADAPADPDAPAQLARIFWDAPVVQTLLAPAALATSLDEVLPVAVLAAAIPQQQVRSQLARLNKGMWNEGTKDLPLGTLFGEYLYDPGLLVVVKQVPRKEDPAKVEARKATPTETRRAARARQRPVNPATNEKELPRYEWMQASEEFVYVLNQRFHAAALARKGVAAADEQPAQRTSESPADDAQSAAPKAAEPAVPKAAEPAVPKAAEPAVPKAAEPAVKTPAAKPNSPSIADPSAALDRPEDDAFGTVAKQAAAKAPANAAMPVELHEGANVVAEYHLNWPADLAEKLAGVEVSPLAIHYVRIEETGRIGKLLAHYRKFLKGKDTALRYIDKGRWIDHLDGGTAAGRKRSVDVMITSANREENPAPAAAGTTKTSDRTKSGDEPLVVEILSIEIPDPIPEPADDSRPKPAEAAKRPLLTQ